MKSFAALPFKSAATALPLFVTSPHAQVEQIYPTTGGVGLVLVPTRPIFYMPNSMIPVYFPSLAEGEKETEPLVHEFESRQAVSVTLGYAYDDLSIAQLANWLSTSP